MDTIGKKEPSLDRRKPRRSRPELGALSSLVSFDGSEVEDLKHDQKIELSKDRSMVVSNGTNPTHGHGHDFARNSSAPSPPGTLFSRGIPSIRRTLSQDWLKPGFSPRPGKEPKKEVFWGGTCVRPAQRLLSNIPSLRSIPEENELDRDEGSELSDDNVPLEGAGQPASSSYGKVVAGRGAEGPATLSEK